MILSLIACSFDLKPLVPYFCNLAFAKDVDVVEAGEAGNVGEVVVDDYDMSSSFHSCALGKAFVFGWIACPMRSLSTSIGWLL
jgi:hypothetical protein